MPCSVCSHFSHTNAAAATATTTTFPVRIHTGDVGTIGLYEGKAFVLQRPTDVHAKFANNRLSLRYTLCVCLCNGAHTMCARMCICLHCNNNIVHQINAFLVFGFAFRHASDTTLSFVATRGIRSLHLLKLYASIWKLNYVHLNTKHQHCSFQWNLSIDLTKFVWQTVVRPLETLFHIFFAFLQCQFGNFVRTQTTSMQKDIWRHSIIIFSLKTINWNESH